MKINYKDIIIEIIRHEVFGESAPEPRKIKKLLVSFNDFFELALINGVGQLIADYFACEISSASKEGRDPLLDVSTKDFAKLKEVQDAELYRALTFGTELSRIAMILEQAGVDFVPLKGAIIRDMYPKPWMRSSTDIDILVRESDLNKAVEAITTQPAFNKIIENGHHVIIKSKTDWTIEIHYDLNASNSRARALLDDAWNYTAPAAAASAHSTRRTHKYKFDDNFFYTYIMYHLAHHASESGGCGIRAILDISIINQSQQPSAARDEMLESVGLLRFAKIIEAIADKWFGSGELMASLIKNSNADQGGIAGHGKSASSSNADQDAVVARENSTAGSFDIRISKKEIEEIEEFIIANGTHGTQQSKYLASRASSTSSRPRKIFLSYETLSRRYHGLKGRRALTPVYQVRRWVDALAGRGEEPGNEKSISQKLANDSANAAVITEEDIARAKRIIKNLGVENM